MDLSIVIVNYNVKYFIEQSIQSIFRSKTQYRYEIIVVDNDSSDGSIELIQEKFPQVKLIANKENVGFSKANNQGFTYCKGRYILILNPDTLLEEKSIERCIQFLDSRPDAGALGVRMIDGTGKFLKESKRGFPHPSVSFFKFSGLYRLFPKSQFVNAYYQGHIDEEQVAQVEVLAGAFIMVRSDLLKAIGGFDEDYFMYGEDIDLSYQIQKKGYKNYYFPDTTIVHYKGESTKKGSLNYVKVFYQAMIIFSKKHLSSNYSFLFNAALQMAIYSRGAWTVLRNFFKKIYLPVIEIGLSLLLIFFFQEFWASHYHGDPDYYNRSQIMLNLMLYSGIFLLSMFLHGAYDHPYNFNKIKKGITTAAIVFAIWYALTSDEWRTSRMILIATILIASIIPLLIRSVLKGIQTGNFNILSTPNKHLAIVASEAEFLRAKSIFEPLNTHFTIMGRISPDNEMGNDPLGRLEDLSAIIRAKNLDSIIFCSKDVSAEEVMNWMTELSGVVSFRLLPQESESIIGSSSRNLPGELYTVDMQYSINETENRRAKSILDILSSVVILIASLPFLWLSNIRAVWLSAWRVLRRKNTWVGYLRPVENHLPIIRRGIWEVDRETSSSESKKLKNFLYARDYTWRKDLGIILSNIFKKHG